MSDYVVLLAKKNDLNWPFRLSHLPTAPPLASWPEVDVSTSPSWRPAVPTTNIRWRGTAGPRCVVWPWTPSSIPTVVVTTSILARLQLLCVELRLVARSVLLLPAEQEESVVERRTRKRIKLNCVAYLLPLLHCKVICKHIFVRNVTERPPEIKKLTCLLQMKFSKLQLRGRYNLSGFLSSKVRIHTRSEGIPTPEITCKSTAVNFETDGNEFRGSIRGRVKEWILDLF